MLLRIWHVVLQEKLHLTAHIRNICLSQNAAIKQQSLDVTCFDAKQLVKYRINKLFQPAKTNDNDNSMNNTRNFE